MEDYPVAEETPWRTPAGLLDSIEVAARRIFGEEEGCFGPEWQAEVILTILVPELRYALHDAGLNVPLYGPHSAHREEIAAQEMAEAQEAADHCETALYRWFDEAGKLLYVGISGNLGSRTKGHVKGSSWMEFVARSTVERYPRRSVALEVEEAAIKAERPLFNFQHNNTPEAQQCLVEYLIERGRLDLLAPVVSRG